MDDIVKKAIAKWPNVPHCYGWLALDARGAWRMRDERAQQLGLPGDKLTQPTLVGFINRNYAVDERGCWYFQNGPQRVYLQLEATPFIARTDPQHGFVVQTGDPLGKLDRACMTDAGELIVVSGEKVAQVDDRDMAQLMEAIRLNGEPLPDEALMEWINADGQGTPRRADKREVRIRRPGGQIAVDAASTPTLSWHGQELPLEKITQADTETTFGFVRLPQP